MAKQFSAKPIRKVAVGAVAGAATTVLVWLLKSALSVDVPADVASALTVILTFAASYQIPASDEDLIQVGAPPAREWGRGRRVVEGAGP